MKAIEYLKNSNVFSSEVSETVPKKKRFIKNIHTFIDIKMYVDTFIIFLG